MSLHVASWLQLYQLALLVVGKLGLLYCSKLRLAIGTGERLLDDLVLPDGLRHAGLTGRGSGCHQLTWLSRCSMSSGELRLARLLLLLDLLLGPRGWGNVRKLTGLLHGKLGLWLLLLVWLLCLLRAGSKELLAYSGCGIWLLLLRHVDTLRGCMKL